MNQTYQYQGFDIAVAAKGDLSQKDASGGRVSGGTWR